MRLRSPKQLGIACGLCYALAWVAWGSVMLFTRFVREENDSAGNGILLVLTCYGLLVAGFALSVGWSIELGRTRKAGYLLVLAYAGVALLTVSSFSEMAKRQSHELGAEKRPSSRAHGLR